jgi:hypothetical protein
MGHLLVPESQSGARALQLGPREERREAVSAIRVRWPRGQAPRSGTRQERAHRPEHIEVGCQAHRLLPCLPQGRRGRFAISGERGIDSAGERLDAWPDVCRFPARFGREQGHAHEVSGQDTVPERFPAWRRRQVVDRLAPARAPTNQCNGHAVRVARDRTPAHLIEEEIRGPPAELVEARAKRGQRRIGEMRERHIVEPNHRDILRDAESGRLQDLHDADRIHVGPGHHRRARPGGAFKELSGARTATGQVVVLDADDQFGRARQSALRQRVTITPVPFRDRWILEPADEGDATVAVRDQVAHSFADALPVVGDNRRAPDLRIVVRDGHQRQPQASEGGQPNGRVNRDPPVNLAGERRGGNVGRCPAEHQESSATFACNALDTPQNAAVVFAAQDFHHGADREIAHGALSASGRRHPATPVDSPAMDRAA